MQRVVARLLAAVFLVALASAPAFAQGGTTSSLSGTVLDTGGGVIPGATVVIKNDASSRSFTVVTNNAGVFSIPAIEAGTYTVTISLSGFKTANVKNVQVTLGVMSTMKATLEVGSLTETVEVRGGSEIVNTQTPTISSTLNADQINKMPMPSRNAINAVTFLPGVNTAGSNRDSNFNGLPDSFVAISLDGVNNNENFNKSTEGLFAMVTPRQDAVEAVTITTAANGADVGGHGAVQISFVTRSGSNRYSGSLYEYHRDPGLNTNYYFNELRGLPKNDVVLNQYGFRQGGPIKIPGVYDGSGKAFFFGNYEELRLPNNFSRTRVIISNEAFNGLYRYNVSSGGVNSVRQVDLFALAAQNGHVTTTDPTVIKLINDILSATRTGGVTTARSDPNTMDYNWQSPGNQVEKQPVVRLDYNLTAAHRLSGVYNWQVVIRDPDQLNGGDVRFPGFSNYSKYVSYRPLSSGTLRSTLSGNLVNELRGGIKWGPGYFGQDSSNGPQTFEGATGYAVAFGNIGSTLTNWHAQNGPSWRSAWSWNIDDTLSWQRNQHNLSFGFSLYMGNVWLKDRQIVPGIGLGVIDNDPAASMFTTANFAGASNAQLTAARQLYAVLTGRVSSITGTATLDEATNEYVFLGQRRRAGRMPEYSLFVQDSWRLKPTLTLNAGVRWDIQQPWEPVNDVMSQSTLADACGISGLAANGTCNFFQPGASSGIRPSFAQFNKGTPGYNTDWNNFAPNVGIAWRPNVQSGVGRLLLGDPDQATVRAGYSVAYDRQGMAVFTGQYGSNPGSSLSVTRSVANGNFFGPGETYPLLFRERGRLAPPPSCAGTSLVAPACVPVTASFPIAVRANRADNINIFHPDIKVAFARSFTASFQRSITRDMAVDVRYVGTRGVNQWTEEEYNERNIIENGFLDEFKLAMNNLQANIAAGRGNTFAYFGAGTSTSPLPIYLAYFNASNQASNAAAYTGGNWTNTTFVGRLSRNNPNPNSGNNNAAADLDGDPGRRANAIAAGLAPNFFVVNPDVGGVGVFVSDAYSSYDAMQIEVRRRFAQGLQITGSYQYALEYESANRGKHFGRVSIPNDNVRHAIKMQWNYSVPVGRGRRFGADLHPVLDYALGGWEFDGAGRIQARTLNFGNVRLVGMTLSELTKEYKYRIGPDPVTGVTTVTILPDDIILNTRRAFNTSATSATGYSDLGVPQGRYFAPANGADCIQLKTGDCAPSTLLVRAPFFGRIDVGLSKKFRFTSRSNFELRLDVLNVFNNINFNPVGNPGTDATIFQVTSAYTDASNTFDPGGRLGQIVIRLNW